MDDASPETRRYIEELRALPVKPPKPEAKPKKPLPSEPVPSKSREPSPVKQRNYTGWLIAITVILLLILFTANRIAMSIDKTRVY